MKSEICNVCCKTFELHETQYDMFPLCFKNWKKMNVCMLQITMTIMYVVGHAINLL